MEKVFQWFMSDGGFMLKNRNKSDWTERRKMKSLQVRIVENQFLKADRDQWFFVRKLIIIIFVRFNNNSKKDMEGRQRKKAAETSITNADL